MTNKKDFKIGGEFSIDPRDFEGISSFKNESDFLFSSGRSALMAILNYIVKIQKKTAKIYLPYYLCPSVVHACRDSGIYTEFYELDEFFQFPLSYLDKMEQNTILLTVNYFGFVDDSKIVEEVKERRSDIVTISDRVQDFYSLAKSSADFAFTSLRKFFPIPEGGIVHAKNISWDGVHDYPRGQFSIYKIIGSLLKNSDIADKDYLYFFSQGEQVLDASKTIERASEISHYLFDNLDFIEAQNKRKQNYDFIYEEGDKLGIKFLFAYKQNIIPLAIPVIIEERDRTKKELMDLNIFLPIHWEISEYNICSSISTYISKKEISLIIDQRYDLDDIRYQIQMLKKITN